MCIGMERRSFPAVSQKVWLLATRRSRNLFEYNSRVDQDELRKFSRSSSNLDVARALFYDWSSFVWYRVERACRKTLCYIHFRVGALSMEGKASHQGRNLVEAAVEVRIGSLYELCLVFWSTSTFAKGAKTVNSRSTSPQLSKRVQLPIWEVACL